MQKGMKVKIKTKAVTFQCDKYIPGGHPEYNIFICSHSPPPPPKLTRPLPKKVLSSPGNVFRNNVTPPPSSKKN